MSWVAVAIAGSAVIGAVASNRAASKQTKAQQKAIDAQNELIGPFQQAGVAGLGGVQEFVDEGSNFSDTQAFKDIINSQKARGQQLAGNTLTSLLNYNNNNFRPQRLNELSFLPTLGANAAVGQATNIGNAFGNIGTAQADGITGIGNAANNAIGQFLFLNQSNPAGGNAGLGTGFGASGGGPTSSGFGGAAFNNTFPTRGNAVSDIRLKENIEQVGVVDGMNIYQWEWNDIAKERGVTDPTIGVIAQEIDQQYVTEVDGYLTVNYGGLFNAT